MFASHSFLGHGHMVPYMNSKGGVVQRCVCTDVYRACGRAVMLFSVRKKSRYNNIINIYTAYILPIIKTSKTQKKEKMSWDKIVPHNAISMYIKFLKFVSTLKNLNIF